MRKWTQVNLSGTAIVKKFITVSSISLEAVFCCISRKWKPVSKIGSFAFAENEKKKAENADKDGEFLNGFGVDPEEPDTNFYKPEDDATENVSPEEESENVDQ